MLKLIIPTIMLIPLTWLSKKNMIWVNSTTHRILISLISLSMLFQTDSNMNFSLMFFADPLSTPLIILTTWLLPLMIIASQSHLIKLTTTCKKLY